MRLTGPSRSARWHGASRRRAARLAIAALAVLPLCLVVSCERPRAIVAEIEAAGWRYSVQTEHYTIHTNISRELIEQAAVVSERAYAGAAKRLSIRDTNPAFIKSLERTFEAERKLVYAWENGTKQYALPDGVILYEWPAHGTTYQFVLPDGRRFAFWKQAMYGRKVALYLCKDKAELDENLPSKRGPGRGGWGPGTGVIAIIMTYEETYRNLDDLAHEISHQCMSYVVYSAPAWLDEGLAMYAGIGSDGKYRAPLPRRRLLREYLDAVADGTLVPIETLIGMDYAAYHMTKSERLHYAESWAFVHFLMHSDHPQIEGKLFDYLTELRKGRDAGEAFAEVYDLELLNAEWPKYMEDLARKQLQPAGQDNSGIPGVLKPTRRAAAIDTPTRDVIYWRACTAGAGGFGRPF